MISLLPEKQGTFLRASISNVCNFSCQYCATDLGMENHTPVCMDAPLLTAEQYIKNIEMISKHGFKIISFTGGEPLLNPEFEEIVKGCRPFFETIEITTNGTLLLKNLDVIKEYVDILKISIDAFDEEFAVKIAKNSMAKKTKSIIEACCSAGVKTIGFNFVYMKQNEKELPKLVDFAHNLKEKYGTNIYISVLDLYYSEENRGFWKEQFVNLADVREGLLAEGKSLNRRLRVGCDSYNFIWNDIVVNMKDSISCTHRSDMCDKCEEYCQEGIYSLKHSASGWISVCPSNNPEFGELINGKLSYAEAHKKIDKYVGILNEIHRMEFSGETFIQKNGLGDIL